MTLSTPVGGGPRRSGAPGPGGHAGGRSARPCRTGLRRLVLIALPSLLATLPGAPARASYDLCAEPSWTLTLASLSDCANIAALSPGNDTRANLLLLLADQHAPPEPAPPAPQPVLGWTDFRARLSGQAADDTGDYASGEGSRCRSLGPGSKAFSDAVDAAPGLSAEDRKALTAARAGLGQGCDSRSGISLDPLPEVTSPQGRAFVAYVTAARAFYAGDFAAARAGFATLRSSPDPWLADTADYMVARTGVNALQVDAFDEYGTRTGRVAGGEAAAHAAAADLDAYLKDHPDGRYVASARGLQRRVSWLAGWTGDLAARLSALLDEPPAARGIDDAALAEEIDNKLLPDLTPAMTRSPILLAVLDLKAMRRVAPGDPSVPQSDLAAQRDAFAAAPALYGFLVAAQAFYGKGDAGAVLRGLPDDTHRRDGGTLWFSRQLLRGLALGAARDPNARGFWRELLPGATRPLEHATAELGLALEEERRGTLDEAFAPGSPLDDPALRAILLVHDAGPALLRARATDEGGPARERQVALFTLLAKELAHARYGDFLRDVARVPADAPTDGPVTIDPLGEGAVPLGLFVRGETAGNLACPALAATAARLAAHPDGARDRLCLAEWLRLNGFDAGYVADPPGKDSLGAGPSAFPGPLQTRSSIYRALIRAPAGSADERAYALYRAVRCYEPVGNNGCGAPDAPKAERHRWYDQLRRDYPGSRWARQLDYWW